MRPKKEFVVCYDYGMGGIWGPVWATSVQEITDKYPELVVVEAKPEWMSSDLWRTILGRPVADVDGEPNTVLQAALEDRITRSSSESGADASGAASLNSEESG